MNNILNKFKFNKICNKKFVNLNNSKKKFIKIDKSNKDTFYINKIKNRIVIKRDYGGLGDIVNVRPLLKTIKTLYPNKHITCAIPRIYKDILNDSIYIDEIIDISSLDLNNYESIIEFGGGVCSRYERSKKPFCDKHRSEIYAEILLDIKLIDHDYHFKLNNNIKKECIHILQNIYNYNINQEKKVCIFPRSTDSDRSITNDVTDKLISMLKKDGYNPCIIHNKNNIQSNKVPVINKLSLKQLLHIITIFDYAISVDTGPFHLCGALDISTLGIFGWTDAKILGKYHKKFTYVQKHRDDKNGLECCPCWDRNSCKYKKINEKYSSLHCMDIISSEEIYKKFQELVIL